MEASKHRVSIGIPVYNGERYIAQAIESLQAQTYRDFELVICDNASTDRTREICASYAARDARIRYYRNETNLGAAENHRRVFEFCSGEYFKWAAADDLCGPEFLARCLEVLDRQPSVVLAYPRSKLIDAQGEVLSEYEDRLHLTSSRPSERFSQLFQRLRLCNPMYGLIRAHLLRRTALMGNYIAGDIPMLAELSLYGQFWEVPEFLFYRRFHPQASTSIKSAVQLSHFYDPRTDHRRSLIEWKHLRAHLRAVRRAPVGLVEKMRLARFLLRLTLWRRNALARELAGAIFSSDRPRRTV